jgi:hypothetical protein
MTLVNVGGVSAASSEEGTEAVVEDGLVPEAGPIGVAWCGDPPQPSINQVKNRTAVSSWCLWCIASPFCKGITNDAGRY